MRFQELIKSRQSVRQYASIIPSREVLTQVLEAARLAPSAVNYQPWQFIIVTDAKALADLQDCYHRDWINSAPACIAVLGNHQEAWHRSADNKDHCDIDVAIAIDHLTLQAAELGLGTCWVCNFDVEAVVSLFDLDEHLEPIALIPIGYPADSSVLNAKEKKRKPFDDVVTWIE